MVVAADAYEEASVVGDILVGMAKNKGVAALVTDGMARDVDGLNAVGIPIFARGLSPNSPYKDGPGEIGLPVAIGGVTVNPGDLVIGDQDGIVVVAREALAAVADALAEVKAKEAKMDELVRQGATSGPWLAQALEEKGVRYLD
jgi:4-hydroxy-4-methyl-2-oxoglutarate aldolase